MPMYQEEANSQRYDREDVSFIPLHITHLCKAVARLVAFDFLLFPRMKHLQKLFFHKRHSLLKSGYGSQIMLSV